MGKTIFTFPERSVKRYLNTDSVIDLCRDVYDYPVTKATIYRAKQIGQLHPLKRGKHLLFPIADVRKWIEGNNNQEVTK